MPDRRAPSKSAREVASRSERRFYVRAPHAGWPHSVTAGASRWARARSSGAIDAGDGTREGLPGRDAERFGMGPAVVLGQDLAEAAGPVRHGAVADLAAGDRQLGNGHSEAAGR